MSRHLSIGFPSSAVQPIKIVRRGQSHGDSAMPIKRENSCHRLTSAEKREVVLVRRLFVIGIFAAVFLTAALPEEFYAPAIVRHRAAFLASEQSRVIHSNHLPK